MKKQYRVRRLDMKLFSVVWDAPDGSVREGYNQYRKQQDAAKEAAQLNSLQIKSEHWPVLTR